ncbi:hypothetical protein Glove_718g12 [Diversispora epigaea]|uniref:Uncharacterized protein n=1 Tax=Diversispora epigaea TaxID=1348612 RepID=A0A397G1M4_9GLOM|nr:hypothetical protein Glove_718g12 [Diversispora epigaea]
MSSSNTTSNASTRVNSRNLVGSWRNNNISNSVVKTLEVEQQQQQPSPPNNNIQPPQDYNSNNNNNSSSSSGGGGGVKIGKPYPLTNKWTFYHDKYVPNATPEEYEDNLKSVATVTTVQNFWEVYNNITGPEQLLLRSSLHFMKNGIRPVWEDPRNENGGAWFFKVNKTNTAVVWRELLMLLIGEQFEECVAKDDDIFGISVSSRYNSDIFTIWNKSSSANEKAKVIEKLKETLNPIELQNPYYKAHKEHAAFKK